MPPTMTVLPAIPSSPTKRPCPDTRSDSPGPDSDSSGPLSDPISDPVMHPFEPICVNVTSLPAKRRKLTNTEKEELQALKELRIREKEELKTKRDQERHQREEEKRIRDAQREEEKRLREEERIQRDAQRERERKQKEEERRVREDQRRKKADEAEEKRRQREDQKRALEEEKKKKERSQLRLNAFFVKPKEGPSNRVEATERASAEISTKREPATVPDQAEKTGYERTFLPFSLPSNTTLAPDNAQLPSTEELERVTAELDQFLRHPNENGNNNLTADDVLERYGVEKQPVDIYLEPSVSSILVQALVPLPAGVTEERENPIEQLKMRHTQFDMDVRPPYHGTMTIIQDRRTALRLARQPNRREISSINYDYDSEAEWEAGDGEDVDEDEDEIESDDDGEDLQEFLDDEDDVQKGRMPTIGANLEPVSTGICWEGADEVVRNAETGEEIDFSHLEIGMITWPFPQSIDPFSTQYWQTETKPSTTGPSGSGQALPSLPTIAESNNGKPPKRTVPVDILDDFRQEISGSDMTKIALVEALKKRFPKVPKDAIINSLSLVAERVKVGSKATEKRWILKT